MTMRDMLPSNMLPHSYPFIFIDRILEVKEGESITCLKNVTINEEFFLGHFKENPVMPGVLIIEAMAQASGLIIGTERKGAYLTRVKDARFKSLVMPGDQLIIKASLIQKFSPMYVFKVEAFVNDEAVSEAEITLTVM